MQTTFFDFTLHIVSPGIDMFLIYRAGAGKEIKIIVLIDAMDDLGDVPNI